MIYAVANEFYIFNKSKELLATLLLLFKGSKISKYGSILLLNGYEQ